MMNVDQKYKKWGWGAVIGLVGVILIAGFVIAASLSTGPKPSENSNGDKPGALIGQGGESAEKPEGNKPADKPADKPAEKPESGKPSEKPAEKPADKPAEKPAVKPESKPAEKPAAKPAAPKNDLPKSGPEDVMPVFAVMAVAAMALAYAAQAKRA